MERKSSCIGLTMAEMQSRWCKDWNSLDWMMVGVMLRMLSKLHDAASGRCKSAGGLCSTPWLLLSYSK